MKLQSLRKKDVQEIIDLALPEESDVDSLKVTNISDMTSADLLEHDKRKQKIMDAIDALGQERRAELNAVMLLGRGDGEVEDFSRLVDHSASMDSGYMAGKAPLSKYLEQGLKKLGI